MAKSTVITLRLDPNIKNKVSKLFKSMGMSLSTATDMFYHQAIKENRLPFQPTGDGFYSTKNQRALSKSIQQFSTGHHHVHRLISPDEVHHG